MFVQSTVIRYGDHVDTDVIIPARYLNTTDPAELAAHCMEDLDSDFKRKSETSRIIVAGRNFGCGSSRTKFSMPPTAMIFWMNGGNGAAVKRSPVVRSSITPVSPGKGAARPAQGHAGVRQSAPVHDSPAAFRRVSAPPGHHRQAD